VVASSKEVGEFGEGGFFSVALSLHNPLRIQHPLVARANMTNIHRDAITDMHVTNTIIHIGIIVRIGRLGLRPSSLSFPCHGYVFLLDAVGVVGGCWLCR